MHLERKHRRSGRFLRQRLSRDQPRWSIHRSQRPNLPYRKFRRYHRLCPDQLRHQLGQQQPGILEFLDQTTVGLRRAAPNPWKPYPYWEGTFYQISQDVWLIYWDTWGGHASGMNISWGNILTANQWTHLVYTWDGSTGKAYANGQLVNTVHATNPALNQDRDTGVAIGGHLYLWAEGYFNGNIDEVMVFDTVLSDAQVNDIYSNQLSGHNYSGGNRVCQDCSAAADYPYSNNFDTAPQRDQWTTTGRWGMAQDHGNWQSHSGQWHLDNNPDEANQYGETTGNATMTDYVAIPANAALPVLSYWYQLELIGRNDRIYVEIGTEGSDQWPHCRPISRY